MVQLLWKTVWRFLKKKKLKIELPNDPACLLLDVYPDKTLIQKDTWTPVFIVALFTIAKTYIYNRILLSHKKNEIIPFAKTWIDLVIFTLSEISQTNTNYHMISLKCGILKKK